jgi:hypothetical protein
LIPQQDGDDDLKKKQLMELAIINGTYRDNSVPIRNTKIGQHGPHHLMNPNLQHFIANPMIYPSPSASNRSSTTNTATNSNCPHPVVFATPAVLRPMVAGQYSSTGPPAQSTVSQPTTENASSSTFNQAQPLSPNNAIGATYYIPEHYYPGQPFTAPASTHGGPICYTPMEVGAYSNTNYLNHHYAAVPVMPIQAGTTASAVNSPTSTGDEQETVKTSEMNE